MGCNNRCNTGLNCGTPITLDNLLNSCCYDILFLKETILVKSNPPKECSCTPEEPLPPDIEPEEPDTELKEPDFDFVQADIDMVSKDTDVTSLDLVFIQDISGSFSDDLPTVNNNLDSIMNSITSRISDTTFGLVTFSDIPDKFKGFGHEGDSPFTLVLPLTKNKSSLKDAYASINLEHGGDTPESQLIALKETCTAPLGYRANSKKVLFVLTDAIYHTTLDDPRYPPQESVIRAINELGAFTIFGIDSTSRAAGYESLRAHLNGLITIIGSSSEFLADAIMEALEASQESIKLPVSGRVYNALPESSIIIKASDSTGKTITFNTVLLAYGVFKAGSAFDGLANGSITFTISGIDKYDKEFTIVKTIYKY